MNIHAALYAYLSTESGVAALASTRGYPSVIPQDVNYPAWAYQQISGFDKLPHDGPANLQTARFQFTSVAESYLAAQQLALAIQAALDGFRGTMGGVGGITVHYAHVEGIVDGYNTGIKTFTTRCDAVIIYSE